MVSLISLVLIAVGTAMFAMLYTISLQLKALSFRIGQMAFRTCGIIRYAAMAFEAVTIAGYVLFVFGTTFNFRLTPSNPTPIRIMGGVFTLLLCSTIWLPLFVRFAAIEDNDLALRFGDEYLKSTKRVGLFRRKRPAE